MSRHLRPDDVVAALDGALAGHGRAHLDACAACRATVADARLALEAATDAGAVPEPSPLFWDHLSARVRRATAAEPLPASRRWWPMVWAPLLAGGLATALVLATVARAPQMGDAASRLARGDDVPVADDWGEVVAVVGQLSGDDMRGVFAPETSLLVEDLTPAERDVFVQLLEREMGSAQ